MSPKGGRRKGAGRKPKPESERLGKSVTIRLSNEEARQLEELAGEEKLASYLRRLIGRHLRRVKR